MIKLTAAVTALLTVAFAVSPVFTAPFSGFTPDQLPIPQVNPPVQPAGYAFAIWGVIYLWLIISAVFGLWKRSDDTASDWHNARKPLVVSLLIGVPWIAIAAASPIWASVTIILMAICAIIALINAPKRDRWLFQAPVALYAGWLTAASWVSIATVFAGYGILLGAFGWAIVGITGALIIALLVFRQRSSAPEYFASIIWALVGIIVANTGENLTISILAAVGISLLTLTLIKHQRA